MITIKDKKDCCGCTACYNACPKKAIAMQADQEGFLYKSLRKKDFGQFKLLCDRWRYL